MAKTHEKELFIASITYYYKENTGIQEDLWERLRGWGWIIIFASDGESPFILQ